MKAVKRGLSVLLALVMLLSVICVSAFAESSIVFKAEGDKTSVTVGDTFTLTVKAGVTDAEISAILAHIYYDPTMVEYQGSESGSFGKKFSTNDISAQDANGVYWVNGNYATNDEAIANTEESVLFTATFKVLSGATSAFLPKLEVKDVYDGDYNEVSRTSVQAKISFSAPVVEPTGIALDKNTLDMKSGASETLVATVQPAGAEGTVTWSSSNDKVATVDETGKVTAVAKGTATITAKVGTFQATCTVTVACSHRKGDDVAAKPATCTEPGNKAYFYCDECKTYFKDAAMTEAYGENEWVLSALGHNVTLTPAKAATCTATGNSAYYTCGRCGKFFSDEAATKEIAENSWVLSTIAHDYKWEVDEEATEDVTGLKHEECTMCHAKRNEGTVIPKLDHTHNMQHHAANPATCTADGTVEYWHCTKCGKDFSDQAGANMLATIVDRAKGHSYVGHDKKAATCVATGVETHYTCKNCDLVFNSAMAVTTMNALTIAKDPANHVGERGLRNVRPATCTQKGYTGDTYCKSCNETIITGTEIGTTPHTQKDGYETDGVQHWHVCKDCDTVIGSKTAHVAEEVWKSDSVNHWQVCKDCGAVITATKEAHIETSIWSTDNTNHWHVCSWCNGVIGSKHPHVAGDIIRYDDDTHWNACKDCDAIVLSTEAEHSYQWVIDQKATLYETGLKHEECKCGNTRNMNTEIDKLTVTIKIPFSITVKKTGEADPIKETFKVDFMGAMSGAAEYVTLTGNVIETNGAKTYTGVIEFTVNENNWAMVSDGITLGQIKGSTTGWTYDDTVYYITFAKDDDGNITVRDVSIPVEGEGDFPEFIPVVSTDGSPLVAFTNSYNAKAPVITPPTPGGNDNTPTTGDSGVTVWLIVLPVVALAAAGVVIAKKKREDQ